MCVEVKGEGLESKKVFISYSWSGEKYQERVKILADELISKGIEVIIDFYDLKPGSDTYSFMEKMVNDETIDKVLILIDPKYAAKANEKGATGVSTETQIISPQVYKKIEQNKFIPVIMDRTATGDLEIPTYLENRLYIDLSKKSEYHLNFEKIVREIYEKPLYKKPQLGEIPIYLNDEKKRNETRSFIDSLQSKIKEKFNREKIFFDIFLKQIEDVREIDFGDNKNQTEKIFNATNELNELKEDYVEFLEYYILIKEFDIDIIIDFFEKMYEYSKDKNIGIIINGRYDHIEFLVTELYIYTCMILLENKKYEELEILFETDYNLLGNEYDFSELRLPVRKLRQRNPNHYDYIAELLVSRTIFNGKNYKKKFIEMDLLLFYVSVIRNREKNTQENFGLSDIWYPATFFYLGVGVRISSLQKMKSTRHCENMMKLFGVKTTNELKENFKNFSNYVELKDYRKYEYAVPNINFHISHEMIATKL